MTQGGGLDRGGHGHLGGLLAACVHQKAPFSGASWGR